MQKRRKKHHRRFSLRKKATVSLQLYVGEHDPSGVPFHGASSIVTDSLDTVAWPMLLLDDASDGGYHNVNGIFPSCRKVLIVKCY
mmetsp:Transcript_11755/g.26538  ORF Transcript_11755/g.26538 Transcript_11755/m.26538 type:complete len:85 (-) Transcript_11755:222-476(-)